MATQIDIYDFALVAPEMLHPELLNVIAKDRTEKISHSAMFSPTARLGNVARVGSFSRIDDDCAIGDRVRIGREVIVGYSTVLSDGVNIGSYSDIGPLNLFCEGATVARRRTPDNENQTNIRQSRSRCIVGPKVALPSEFQLGDDAIIPTNATVRQVGRFGLYRRMVTIYGTDEGPRYSVGCQFGVHIAVFRERAENSVQTVVESSNDYLPHFSRFEEIGAEVQRAYEAEAHMVEELKSRHNDEVLGAYNEPNYFLLDSAVD